MSSVSPPNALLAFQLLEILIRETGLHHDDDERARGKLAITELDDGADIRQCHLRSILEKLWILILIDAQTDQRVVGQHRVQLEH